jgi:DNA-binding winged helix-turn-helix (wHTH) protein/Flp pilus assembly protein TadD
MRSESLNPDTGTSCFGPYRLTPDGRLLHERKSVALSPKELALLRLFLGSGGRVVPKREILDRLWPQEEVGEASLTTCVHGLRAALGDHGRRGGYLETVHGRGYRFTAPVARGAIARDARPDRVRVALLPFDEELRSPAYLTDGLVGDVTARLGRWREAGIDVIARQSAARLQATRLDPVRQARRMRIGFLVTGRVRSRSRAIEVCVELVRVRDEVVVWAGEFASPSDGRAALAAEVAEWLGKRLAEQAGSEFTSERRPPVSADPRSYRALLRGTFLNQFRTESGLRRSIHCFEQAIEWDPRCAPAHVALAEAQLNLGWRGYAPPREIAKVARSAIAQALEIDGNDATALSALAFLRLLLDWDLRTAVETLGASESSAEGSDRIPWMRSIVYTGAKRFDAALAVLEDAIELDPFSPNLAMGRLLALWFAGRNDEALPLARALTRAEPEFSTARAIHGCIAAAQGRLEEALREAEAADTLARGDQMTRSACAWIFAVAGRPDAARAVLATLERRAQGRYVSPSFMAIGYAGLGDDEAALAWLERAPAVRCMWYPLAFADPRLTRLRGAPRFEALARLFVS